MSSVEKVCLFFIVLLFAGFFSFVSSSRCSGVGIFETGQTIATGKPFGVAARATEVVGALTTTAVGSFVKALELFFL